MMKFTIPPEYCLIVSAFNQTNSLRGAASLLEMDPSSLVRKVQRISTDFGCLQKVGNKWAVSEEGRRIAFWTEGFLQSQKEVLNEKSTLRISSFAWLAEEVLIPHSSKLQKYFKEGQSFTFKLTAHNQEQELLQGRTDFVIQGHAPTDPTVAYKKVSTYNWVVVVPYAWKKMFSGLNLDETLKLLQKKEFVRHLDLNPENALGFQPFLKSPIVADAVIGLRSAVLRGKGWSVLPAMSVHNHCLEKQLYQLQVPTLIKDEVSVWWIRARKDLSDVSKNVIKWISSLEITQGDE